jgi:membrane protein DedA with SNARE-associated domain
MHNISLIVIQFLSSHGAYILFFALSLGIVGLPIPDETLLMISGMMISQSLFSPMDTFFFAILGSAVGITSSFLIGKFLNITILYRLIRHYPTEGAILDKVAKQYERYGVWSLTMGYFIPGFRHFIGIFAGMMALPYKKFALFAYMGAVLWCLFFLLIGYFLGHQAIHFFEEIFNHYTYFLILFFMLVLLGILLFSVKKRRI